jgi:DNA-binding protein HU-beta
MSPNPTLLHHPPHALVAAWIESLHRISPYIGKKLSTRLLRGGSSVNKSELIEHIAQQADISKAAAARALEAVVGGVKTTLKKGGSVSIVGFGTFAVTKRAARTGRNPRTNAAIKIKAAKVPKFRPGKGLKDAVN